jgi:hypothetical protein
MTASLFTFLVCDLAGVANPQAGFSLAAKVSMCLLLTIHAKPGAKWWAVHSFDPFSRVLHFCKCDFHYALLSNKQLTTR